MGPGHSVFSREDLARMSDSNVSLRPERWLYALITIHVFFWTLIPTLIRRTLPMDALEGFVWGQHWQLGYDRNPWLNAWLTTIAVKVGGTSGWMVYVFGRFGS